MTRAPFAGRPRAKRDQHPQNLAGVVTAAAHFHHVGIARQVARPHLRVCLKAAGAGDHGFGLEVVASIRSADGDTLDAAQVAMHGADRRVKTQVDAEAIGDPLPLRQLPDAAAGDVDYDPALEVTIAVDLGVLLEWFEDDAGLAHP